MKLVIDGKIGIVQPQVELPFDFFQGVDRVQYRLPIEIVGRTARQNPSHKLPIKCYRG